MSKLWSELTRWSSQKMILISSMLDLKTTIFIKPTSICQTIRSNKNGELSLVIALLSPRFRCILENLRPRAMAHQVSLQICLSLCYQPLWIGQLSFGTLRTKWRLSHCLLLKALKNMFMMYNGPQFILQFSRLLTEMVTLTFGISQRIQNLQSQGKKLSRQPTLVLTKILMTQKPSLAASGPEMEED